MEPLHRGRTWHRDGATQESRLIECRVPMADDPRRRTKSKYTADRGIPGAFEGETVTRRRFMTGTAHTAGAVAAAAFTLPALGFAAGPLFEKKAVRWEDVGSVADFP